MLIGVHHRKKDEKVMWNEKMENKTGKNFAIKKIL